MNRKICTDITQSRHLAELGFNLGDTDMYWWVRNGNYDKANYDNAVAYVGNRINNNNAIPAWSLTALIDLMPSKIETGEEFFNKYTVDYRKHKLPDNVGVYQVAYGNSFGSNGTWHDMINSPEEENMIDAVYDMILWLKEYNYI